MPNLKSTLLLSLFIPAMASASSLDTAQATQIKTNQASADSQARINKSVERSFVLQSEIEQLQEEVKNLEVYRDHLTALVNSQQQEVASLETQIGEIQSTRQGVVPLMYQMLDGLQTLVENDMPIKQAQREARVEKLVAMMARADVSEAEKYRRILEAYQIELDYGTKLAAYQGTVEIDGEAREVDMLHLGRISLVARSLNGKSFWAWNKHYAQWQSVDVGFKSELDKAFSIANKQAAPSLITLPVSATEAR